MSAVGWIIFLVVALPVIGVVTWLLFDDAVVQVEPGQLGLLVVHGRPTDRVLLPGRHLVPSFRRMMVIPYPSLELSYLAGEEPGSPDADAGGAGEVTALDRHDPPLRVTLGDRTEAIASYTVRFRLRSERLRDIHERIGTDGLWGTVRDQSRMAVAEALHAPEVTALALAGDGRATVQSAAAVAVAQALAAEGFEMTLFNLRYVDLGAHGAAIQEAARKAAESTAEESAVEQLLARARLEADLYPLLEGTLTDGALRHRELDIWRALVDKWDGKGLPIIPPFVSNPPAAAEPEPDSRRRARRDDAGPT